MSRREKHFQDTEEKQQETGKKKKVKKKENLRDRKGVAFLKEKIIDIYLQIHLGFKIVLNDLQKTISRPVLCK